LLNYAVFFVGFVCVADFSAANDEEEKSTQHIEQE